MVTRVRSLEQARSESRLSKVASHSLCSPSLDSMKPVRVTLTTSFHQSSAQIAQGVTHHSRRSLAAPVATNPSAHRKHNYP